MSATVAALLTARLATLHQLLPVGFRLALVERSELWVAPGFMPGDLLVQPLLYKLECPEGQRLKRFNNLVDVHRCPTNMSYRGVN